jgi:hypothetical protein
MTITILIIDKTGKIKELEVKNYDENELYKKAGFKSAEGFELQTEWGAEIKSKSFSVSIYGKLNGRAGQENKYEFPPPIDTTLFFGSCVIVNKKDGEPVSISKEEWNAVYQHLYGGFEDIGDEDSEDEEETDEDDDRPRTKQGYVKDGFIVDDNEVDDEDYDTEDETSEEEVIQVKSKKNTKKNVKTITKQSKESSNDVTKEETNHQTKEQTKQEKTVKKNKPKTVFETILKEVEENYLDCSSELAEESYV